MTYGWTQAYVVATQTLATVLTIISDQNGTNVTSVTTIYNTELDTKWPVPTDINSDGTKTSVYTTFDPWRNESVAITALVIMFECNAVNADEL